MRGAYVLEEDVARRWLADLIVAAEMEELDDDLPPSAPAPFGSGAAAPLIGLGWDPRAPGQEDVASRLIQQAQHPVGALAGPPHTRVTVQYVDDGDDWAYQFLLHFAVPGPLIVAAPPRPVTRLGGGHGRGLEGACAVLHEAAEAANELLDQVAAFGAA